ncbi:MAG: hypothetical protein WAU81_15660 [Candidatus Aminicenantales bacterium]
MGVGVLSCAFPISAVDLAFLFIEGEAFQLVAKFLATGSYPFY